MGAIEENTDRILSRLQDAGQQGADLLICSELAVTGYPPEDLLLRPDLMHRVEAGLARLTAATDQVALLVGHPWRENGQLYNAASFYFRNNFV